MKKTVPKITVIIPAYNAAAFIKETLNAVLEQTFLPDEILVIDDGSTDKTKAIVQSFPQVKYFYQANAGSAAAVNQGMKLTNAPYIAFLDHDDVWHREKLAKQMRVFQENQNLSAVFCLARFFLDKKLSNAKKYATLKEPMKGYLRSCILFKRSILERIGGFDEHLTVAESIDWISRLKETEIKTEMIKEVLVFRRIHGQNTSILQKSNYKELLNVLKKRINKKRINSLV